MPKSARNDGTDANDRIARAGSGAFTLLIPLEDGAVVPSVLN